MAGFFRNFSRSGKGVAKDAPEKKRFILFFEILWRKLWQIIGLNILYFIIVLPLMAYVIVFIMQSVGIQASDLAGNTLFMIFGYILNLPPFFMWLLVGASAILYGPATCGLTYILRNYTRQEHAWTFSDFFERAKQNFKQGLLAGVIDIALVLSCSMYVAMDTSALGSGQWYLVAFKYIALIVFVIYFIMRFYIYTLIVTFDMSFKAIIKNAWIFVILGFFRNLCSVFFIVLSLATSVGYMLAFFGLFTLAFCRYIAVFNSYPVIEQYMLQPIRRKQEEEGSITIIEPIFSDDVKSEPDKKDE
ncbi:MAG: DUF624 domain-containing protein [Clostridiaceae bacterium]|nr:DUF624 domain-containing protein [Clostridiaceae bacterium]